MWNDNFPYDCSHPELDDAVTIGNEESDPWGVSDEYCGPRVLQTWEYKRCKQCGVRVKVALVDEQPVKDKIYIR